MSTDLGVKRLTLSQKMQAMAWSKTGVPISEYGVLLGMSQADFMTAFRSDPEVADAIRLGHAAGVREVAGKLYEKALAGDVSAMRFYLERIGGGVWAPPRVATVVTPMAMSGPVVQVDLADVERRLLEHSRLLDSAAVVPGSVGAEAVSGLVDGDVK